MFVFLISAATPLLSQTSYPNTITDHSPPDNNSTIYQQQDHVTSTCTITPTHTQTPHQDTFAHHPPTPQGVPQSVDIKPPFAPPTTYSQHQPAASLQQRASTPATVTSATSGGQDPVATRAPLAVNPGTTRNTGSEAADEKMLVLQAQVR